MFSNTLLMENIEIHQKLINNVEIDPILFKKMSLVFNAIEDGWNIKKIDKSDKVDKPEFTKKTKTGGKKPKTRRRK